jgi:hypothetical protein
MESTQELAIYGPWRVTPEQLQHDIPRDTVCLRNTSVDTMHKGDTEHDDDDDDNNNNNKFLTINPTTKFVTIKKEHACQ